MGPTPPIWNISHCITRERPLRSAGMSRPVFSREVHEDRARLEHREVTGLAIHDRGMRPLGLISEELRSLLLELAEIERVHL
jgi:hypothetical protein